MSYFKNATVTVAELYAAAREVCSRLYVANGGRAADVWTVKPLPGTAALSRDDWGWTCHWTIHMPAMPMDARLSRNEADTIMAYVTHELGHALFTDYAAWKVAASEGLAHLTNGLEDVRIELRMAELTATLPNARELLALLTEHCVVKALANDWKPADPKQLAFTLYQYAATHRDVLAYAVPSMPDFAAVCDASQVTWMDGVMVRIKACQNTLDVVALARDIKAELGARRTPEPKGEGEGEGDKGEGDKGEGEAEGGSGEGSGSGEGEAADTSGELSEIAQGDEGATPEAPKGESEDKPATPGARENKGEGKADADANEGTGAGAADGWNDADVTDANQRPTEPDLSDMGDRVSERNGRTPEEVRAENADVTDFLNVPPSTPRSRRNLYSNDAHAAHVAGLIKTPAKLRRDVTKAVRSPDLMDVEHYQTKGRFDARSFVRVDAGAVNVFRRRSEALGQTAAVSLLIDLSTSMRGDRINMATCLALHLGDALKAAGVPFEIAGFTSRTSTNVAADGILVTKGFRDSWHDARTATAGLSNAVQGGTAMLPGIKAMVARLKARAGVSRRILLVLTDGQDGYSTGSNRAAVRAALADGVEVVGMGMLYDASPAFGPAYLTVTSLATVATAGLSSLVNVLREDGPRKRAA